MKTLLQKYIGNEVVCEFKGPKNGQVLWGKLQWITPDVFCVESALGDSIQFASNEVKYFSLEDKTERLVLILNF